MLAGSGLSSKKKTRPLFEQQHNVSRDADGDREAAGAGNVRFLRAPSRARFGAIFIQSDLIGKRPARAPSVSFDSNQLLMVSRAGGERLEQCVDSQRAALYLPSSSERALAH